MTTPIERIRDGAYERHVCDRYDTGFCACPDIDSDLDRAEAVVEAAKAVEHESRRGGGTSVVAAIQALRTALQAYEKGEPI